MVATDDSAILGMQKIPNEHEGIITTGGKHTSSRRIPFYRIYGCRVAAELQQCLTRLSHVEDADEVRISGKGCEEMCVVWRSCQAE